MNDAVSAALANFERVLRWIYPGLLFWAALPFAIVSAEGAFEVSHYAGFYNGLNTFGHIGIVLGSGFLIYLVERYLIYEPLLSGGFYLWRIGPAVGFRAVGRRWYPRANATFMWTRFGMRLQDSTELGERAENRFNSYMASRMAAVHGLGSTWIVGIIIFVIGILNQSAFTDWPKWGYAYLLLLFLVFAAWIWHARMAALAEQYHYNGGPSER